METNKPFSINLDDTESFLSDLFKNDEKAKSILDKSGFTDTQLEVIKILIIAALKSYDLQKQQ